MAGFFGFFNYAKPGPGVSKDAPPKARIIVFFEVLSRKFWNLVRLNLMYLLFSIPSLLLAFFLAHYFFPSFTTDDGFSNIMFRVYIAAVLMCTTLVALGPVQAGLTYVIRNYSREEHAFIWWDFKEAALKNFKQSMIICGIDIAVTFILALDMNMYSSLQTNGIVSVIASSLLFLAFLVFTLMHIYIYPMLVTFHLSVKQIYKNALFFALMKLIPNIGILLLNIIIITLALMIHPIASVLIFVFILFSLINLINNFYAYPKIKKYMIDPVEKKNDEPEEKTFSDKLNI